MFSKFATFGKADGTGLGCYSAKLVAHTHGATIGVEGDAPDATTIAVRFPCEAPAESPAP